MTEKAYIEQVETLISSAQKDVDLVYGISKIELPTNANPLIVLIHGDAEELEWRINYANIHDPAEPSDEEVGELAVEESEKIIKKIKKYINDWHSGNHYHYSFSLVATYSTFVNNTPVIENIKITKVLDIKTVNEAVTACNEWRNQLLERIVFYDNQAKGHKGSTAKPYYTVYDSNNTRIAWGFLEFGNEKGICTWLNQS